MSGEVALISILGPAAIPVVAGAAAVLVGVKLAHYKEQAKMQKEMAQASMARWQAEQTERNRRQEEMNMIMASIKQATDNLAQTSLTETRVDQAPREVSGRGFLDLDQTRAARPDTSAQVRELGELLETLPEGFKEDAEWPFERFLADWKRYSAEAADRRFPSTEELAAFRDSVVRTLNRYLTELEHRTRAEKELFEAAAALLEEVLYQEALAERESYREELTSIRNSLTAEAEARRLDRGDLDLWGRRVESLKTEIEHDNNLRAYRHSLAESVTRHLGDMGYGEVEPFTRPDSLDGTNAVLGLPGGGLLHAAVLGDGRMAFELFPDSLEGMTPRKMEEFRRQEAKWCDDFHELIRRLTADGFSFEIQLEREKPSEAIGVVQVETAADLAEEEEEEARYRDEPRARRH